MKRKLQENEKALAGVCQKLEKLELHEIDEEDENDAETQEENPVDELRIFTEEELNEHDVEGLKAQIALLEGKYIHCMFRSCL